MKHKLFATVALLTGCGTTVVPQEVQAVRDMVVVSDLASVSNVRLYHRYYYTYVNDYFVTLSAGKRHYLVEFSGRCRALQSSMFTAAMVDHRHDPSYLREMDTIKGCVVENIYTATAEQLLEIKEVSKKQATGAVVPAST